MSEIDIIKNFAIDRDSGTGLAKQLKSNLSDYIQNNPPGTRIPPERVMAEVLGISRVTVRNALNHFYNRGMILRKGRNGAYTASVNGGMMEMHPMLAGGGFSSDIATKLKFISFETLPQQRVFWKKAVASFNSASRQVNVKMEELPKEISFHNYSSYVLEQGFDVIMFQEAPDKSFDKLLEPLPENLSKKILSDEYVLKDSGTVLGNAVPIKSATMLICWNKELAASLGIKNIPERLRKGKMYELHCEAAKKMPVDFYAGGHIWDYLCVKGLKNGSDSIDLEFLEKRLDEFARFSGIMNMFITEQKYSLEFVDYFLKGQLLFYMGSSTHLFFYGKDMPFETGAMFCGPEKGCKLSRAGIYLGVYKNSVNKKAAFEFIDYMISEQAQNMIACELWDTPCLKKSSLLFRDIFEQTDKKSIDEYFKGRPLLVWEQSSGLARQQYFLNSETRDVLNGLMKGDFDSKQAAGIIFNRWKDFSNE